MVIMMKIIVNTKGSFLDKINHSRKEIYVEELKDRLKLLYPSAEVFVTTVDSNNYVIVSGQTSIIDEQVINTIVSEIINSGSWLL